MLMKLLTSRLILPITNRISFLILVWSFSKITLLLQEAKHTTQMIIEKLWDSFIEARLLTRAPNSSFALQAIMTSKFFSNGCSGDIPQKLSEIGGLLKITLSIHT